MLAIISNEIDIERHASAVARFDALAGSFLAKAEGIGNAISLAVRESILLGVLDLATVGVALAAQKLGVFNVQTNIFG